MGDRFYEQQNGYFNQPRSRKKLKKVRRLKKDVIAEIQEHFSEELLGLEKMNIANLEALRTNIISELSNARGL